MRKYDIAAYIWPAYTGDEPRSRMFWPEGIGEWQSVRNAASKFEGHSWPRKPLWGYCNEADPYVMQMQIDAAADHGVNVFIYDWYWYDGRPFLEQCLNNGFLKAKNRKRMQFYLMWANHSANLLWDFRLSHTPLANDTIIWDGAVDRRQFETLGERMVETYFTRPEYYCIDGKPVLCIYDIANLRRGLGGIAGVADAFRWLNAQAVRAGLEGIHFQMINWGTWCSPYLNETAGGKETIIARNGLRAMGFESQTQYQMCHFANIDRPYPDIIPDCLKEYERMSTEFDVPYFPHVSVGWDNNPRYQTFRPGIVRDDTPENIEAMLRHAKAYVDAPPGQPPLVTVNSWNEWTETSYLEPDDRYGYGYLEAIRRVFG
ncbi:MAG: glycoside hydrolase family 99-like domain-containing protein [Kiritimatiellaeota bacterium]|nr:glycoside hydrolase family 99-like domain-containing protein [Kiritimatiellota bacterium]